MSAAPPLYLTDAEIAKRLGLQLVEWKATARVLEKDGLPRPNPLFGERRYWPAVVAFLDRLEGLGGRSGAPDTWEENFNGKRTRVEASASR